MPKEQWPGKPATRRYSLHEKADASGRCERCGPRRALSMEQRLPKQLGYGVKSAGLWVHQADIDDGHSRGVNTTEAARFKALAQQTREMKRGPTRS